jgi:hypothetical protein
VVFWFYFLVLWFFVLFDLNSPIDERTHEEIAERTKPMRRQLAYDEAETQVSP